MAAAESMGAAFGRGQVDGTAADPLRWGASAHMADTDSGQGSLVVGTAAGERNVRLWVVGKSVGAVAGLGWLE